VKLSATQEVVGLIASVVGAVIGYWLSERDRRRLGRTPWGLASPLWALFWFLIPLVGLILYLIAHSTGVRRAQRVPPIPGPPMAGAPMGARTADPASMAPTGQPSVGDLFPTYPRPANSQPQMTEPPRPAPSPGSAPPYPSHPPTPDLSQPESASAGQAGVVPSTTGQQASQPAEQTASQQADLASDPQFGDQAGSASPPAWHPDPSGRFHYRWWDGHQWTSHVSVDGQYLIDTSPDQRIGPY
jgi:hypothetical protein